MDEITAYRLDDQEKRLDHLKTHAHDVNQSLMGLNETIRVISKEIQDNFFKLVKVIEKVEILEKDYNTRQIKSNYYKSFISHWPFLKDIGLITIICVLLSIDFPKFFGYIFK